MPRPVDAVRAVNQAQNGTKPAKPVDGSTASFSAGPPESPPALGGTSPAPIAGKVTISFDFDVLPEIIRAVLLLVQGGTGYCGSPSNPPLNGFLAPEAPGPSHPAPHGESNDQEVCRDAEALLVTLSRVRREAEHNGSPERAWCTKAMWLFKAGMNRRRKDATHLIGQLLRSKLIEFREHGDKKGWHQYQATNVGMQRAAGRVR